MCGDTNRGEILRLNRYLSIHRCSLFGREREPVPFFVPPDSTHLGTEQGQTKHKGIIANVLTRQKLSREGKKICWRNRDPSAHIYLIPTCFIQSRGERRRRYNYLRSGSPEGKKGHGGRVEGHHVESELSADLTSTKSLVWAMARMSTPDSQNVQELQQIERRSSTSWRMTLFIDANSKFPWTKDRENSRESN